MMNYLSEFNIQATESFICSYMGLHHISYHSYQLFCFFNLLDIPISISSLCKQISQPTQCNEVWLCSSHFEFLLAGFIADQLQKNVFIFLLDFYMSVFVFFKVAVIKTVAGRATRRRSQTLCFAGKMCTANKSFCLL